MSTITIRPAQPTDAAVILRLNAEHNDVRSSEAGIAHRLAQTSAVETLFLAEIDGSAVGFLCLRLLAQICDDATYAEVSELYVQKEQRRKGVAKSLMDQAIVAAQAAGAKEIVLLTNFRNHIAQRFYFAQNFENYCVALRRTL